MNEHALRRLLEGGGGRAGRLIRVGLHLPGLVYGCLMAMRRGAYRRGWLPSRRLPAPVVSVGNVAAGGTGKTPFVLMLAREFSARGRRPGILLRGWRRDATGGSYEAELYRRLCPKAVVAAGANRLAAARLALEGGADMLLLDDGFQHRRIRRDMDVVLIDATSPWGGGNCLPGGLLREFPSALADGVQAVVITRSDQCEAASIKELRETIARLAPKAAVFAARHRPGRLHRLNGEDVGLAALRNLPVAAFSGIARPEAFHKTLESLGARVVLSFAGSDHADFDPEMIADALAGAGRLGARLVITEKDAAKTVFVRLAADRVGGDIWTLGVDMELDRPGELLELVEKALEKGGREAGGKGRAGHPR